MRTLTKLVPLALLAGAIAAIQACGTVPNDTIPGSEFPPGGVIRGTVFYQGPPPCSQNGQIVGNAVLLVFDRRNPPPPAGLANTAVNFGVVSGDVLFGNIPRTAGAAKVCPDPSAASITASAPYAISPMAAGSYVLQAFYDYTGDFAATFKFRNLPEATDIGGGYIDLTDANQLVPSDTQPPAQKLADGGVYTPPPVLVTKSSNTSYLPIFLPVDIGTPGPVSPLSLRGVPDFTLPSGGYVADNITAIIGSPLPLARPYFYPEGVIIPTVNNKGQPVTNIDGVAVYGSSATRPATVVKTPENPTGNPDLTPVLTFPQDIHVYATPDPSQLNAGAAFQASFPQLTLHWGMPTPEKPAATDITSQANPFHMQLDNPAEAGAAPGGNGGLYVFAYDSADPLEFAIPEGNVNRLWPLVVLAKLKDFKNDPTHQNDPQGVIYQGSDGLEPIVIIQGITLTQDSIIQTVLDPPLSHPDPSNLVDHFTAMLRPNVLCLDPRHVDEGGVIVTPYLCGSYAPGDSEHNKLATCGGVGATTSNIVADGHTPGIASVTTNPQLTSLVKPGDAGLITNACLPTGRYGVNVVYPTGQAWTTPNEAGSCAQLEGNTLLGVLPKLINPGSCSGKPRPVLYSQGTRAVVEILPGSQGSCCTPGSKSCNTLPDTPLPVPPVCTTLTGN